MARSGQTARVVLPPKLIPIFAGEADVRGSYGGRGSAKTTSFAKMTAVKAYIWGKAGREGIILGGRQYMNSLDDSSLAEIKYAIRSEPWLASYFDIGEKYIRTIDGRISYKFAGLDRSIASIKSTSRILLCWVDEAEPVIDTAWEDLIPTLREEDSELWVTWNPKTRGSATDKRFRQTADPRMKVVELNWRDNPWFPAKLDRDRLRDKTHNPKRYDHIWEGAYDENSETLIFGDATVGRVDVPPYIAPRYGMDFGFGTHPSFITKTYPILDKRIIYIAREASMRVPPQDLPPQILEVIDSKDDLIRADSAQPGIIDFLNAQGFRIVGAKKGPGSIKAGINWLQGFKIVIDPDCVAMQEEAKRYSWQVDRLTRKILSVPVDDWNHGWDSVRYGTEDLWTATSDDPEDDDEFLRM